MWWSKVAAALAVTTVLGCVGISAVLADEVCPERHNTHLRHVDVFDGTPEEMAILIPDEGGDLKGDWQLGYVYDAGRFVTVRCKYADGHRLDVRLSARTARCNYRIDSKGTLILMCQ